MHDPYVYKDTNVLINKAKITKQDDLDQFESAIANLALIQLMNVDFRIQSSSDVYEIHKQIFNEVYE